ncbi:hypothetical protein CF319_g6574 [Tilletia indica]|uniref:Uncharacterized protein n=1 Tax=Tilletia indica TaxID=43049 RepID=A0A8T8S9X2_9BASI|nr:hypothetical protein CF327_g1614 [Tilletia walkeri]KAE8219796.1 hypothetical protein CF319_g6574 [Tilletia indica]KAE8235748.1 hypothetical protein A4X13_0g9391 [Tilletia indica]
MYATHNCPHSNPIKLEQPFEAIGPAGIVEAVEHQRKRSGFKYRTLKNPRRSHQPRTRIPAQSRTIYTTHICPHPAPTKLDAEPI